MEVTGFPLLSALWLGILTSISPCPLASNIAAVSFILKRIEHPLYVFISGVLYTVGRVVGYTGLGVLVTFSLLSIPQVSFFLQHYLNKILGPVLIVTGFLLMEVIHVPFLTSSVSERTVGRVRDFGAFGSLLLGILFALSFCPISAALFFGSLIPLSLKNSSHFILPSLYGLGTGLPVLGFAVVITFGVTNIEKIFRRVRVLEYWMRRVTSVIFILVGIYYIAAHIFYLNLFL
jgi:cytochrome c biogenesis protein CcdA